MRRSGDTRKYITTCWVIRLRWRHLDKQMRTRRSRMNLRHSWASWIPWWTASRYFKTGSHQKSQDICCRKETKIWLLPKKRRKEKCTIWVSTVLAILKICFLMTIKICHFKGKTTMIPKGQSRGVAIEKAFPCEMAETTSNWNRWKIAAGPAACYQKRIRETILWDNSTRFLNLWCENKLLGAKIKRYRKRLWNSKNQ